jgi:hypothetical protein
MLKAARVAICLFVAPAVVASGCGSTNTTSTNTTSANTSTSAPANQSSQAVSPSTSSTEAPHATKAPKPKAAEAKRESKAKGSEQSAEAAKPGTKAAPIPPPLSSQLFPKQIRGAFIASCTAGKRSTSSCECVLAQFEESKVEGKVVKEESIAELILLEHDLQSRAAVPPRIQRRIDECSSA